MYAIFLAFYRRTSIEAKRLDSILRTVLYAGFSEALNGLGTIRAYRAEERFIRDSERKLDSENRVRPFVLPSPSFLLFVEWVQRCSRTSSPSSCSAG